MNFQEFKDIGITTITAIGYHESEVSLEIAFSLLPAVDPVSYGPFKKKKFPHMKEGTVIALAYNGEQRGLVRDVVKGYLKNSLEIDFSISDKNVNMKMSEKKMQMVGIKNMDQGWEAVKIISEHLDKVYQKLAKMSENRERTAKVHEKLKTIFCGESVQRPVHQMFTYIFEDLSLKRVKKPKRILLDMGDDEEVKVTVRSTETVSIVPENQPPKPAKANDSDSDDVLESDNDSQSENEHEVAVIKNVVMSKHDLMDIFTKRTTSSYKKGFVTFLYEELVDKVDDVTINFEKPDDSVFEDDYEREMYEFARNAISNFKYYSDALVIMEWLFSIDATHNNIYDVPTKIDRLTKAMVNINFDLGFKIDRSKLCKLINKVEDFDSNYGNLTHHTLTISLSYQKYFPQYAEVIEEKGKRKKKKERVAVFMCYYSGKVTLSGPNEEVDEWAYNRFIAEIKKIYKQIIVYKERLYAVQTTEPTEDVEDEELEDESLTDTKVNSLDTLPPMVSASV